MSDTQPDARPDARPGAQPDAQPDTEQLSTWSVTGMTCEHCVASVTEEIGEIDGVSGVDVDLASGQVTVTSSGPLDRDEVELAVTEAGYALA